MTLGARALASFDRGAPPVLSAAGHPRAAAGVVLFPMIHPAAAMRSKRWRDRWHHDIDVLSHWLSERGFVNGFNSAPAR